MPHMGGPALIRTLAESGKSYPVVFMSGYTSDGAALEDLMTERSFFLGKPFGPAELGAAVRRVLDPVETPAG
jgi:FixJ family two-component response regulator